MTEELKSLEGEMNKQTTDEKAELAIGALIVGMAVGMGVFFVGAITGSFLSRKK